MLLISDPLQKGLELLQSPFGSISNRLFDLIGFGQVAKKIVGNDALATEPVVDQAASRHCGQSDGGKVKMGCKRANKLDKMRRCLEEKDTSSFNVRKEDLFTHEKDAADGIVLLRRSSRPCAIT